jgi:outer membrane protein insertion porin family
MRLTRSRVALAGGGLAVVLVLLVALAHLPFVRARVLAAVLSTLRSGSGVAATADGLSYNLLTLDLRLRGVTAAAVGREDAPFVSLEELHVDLPWSILRGSVAVQVVEASGLDVTLVRGEDGSLNLPVLPESDAPSTLTRVDVGRLSLSRGRVRFTDVSSGWTAGIDGLAVDLQPREAGVVAGPVTASRGPWARKGDLTVEGTAAADVRYDGTSLELTGLTIGTTQGRLQVDGRVDALFTAPAADARVKIELHLAELSPLIGLEPAAEGTVAVDGAVAGPLATPSAAFSVGSERVAWQHVVASAIRVSASATADEVTVESASLAVAGGSVTAAATYGIAQRQADLQLAWADVETAPLLGSDTPITVSSRLTGRADAAWDLARSWSGLEAAASVRAVPAATATGTGVAGDVAITIENGGWRLVHKLGAASVTADGDLSGDLAEAHFDDSTVRGVVTLSGRDLPRTIDVARRAGVAVPADLPIESGELDARVQVSGTFGSPRVLVEAMLVELRAAGTGPVQVEGAFEADLERVRVSRLEASLGGNRLSATGRLGIASGAVQADADVALVDVAALGPEIQDAWKPSGRITGRFTIGGTQARPVVEGTLEGLDLGVAGQRVGNLVAALGFADGTVRVSNAIVSQPEGGRLTATGQYGLETGAFDVAARLDDMLLTPIVMGADVYPVSGRLDGSFEGAGTLDRPLGRGRVAAADLRWEDAHLDRADLEVVMSDDGARLNLRAPSVALSVDALVALQPPFGFASTAFVAPDIPAVVALLGLEGSPQLAALEGSVRGRFEAKGDLQNLPALAVTGDLEQLELRTGDASLRLARPAALRYDGTTAAVERLRLESGGFSLEASGALGPAPATGLEVALRGDVNDLRAWIGLAGIPADAEMSGALAGSLSAAGSLDRLKLTGGVQLQGGSASWPGYPPVTGATLQATLVGDVVEIAEIRAVWQDVTAEARLRAPLRFAADWLPDAIAGSLPASPSTATLTARVANVTPAALAPFAGEEVVAGLSGRVAVQVDLQADRPALEALGGSLVLDELALTAEGVPVTQVRPTRIDVVDAVARVTDWVWDISGNRLEVRGTAGLAGERPLDLSAAGRLDLRMVGAFVPGVTSGGVADFAVRVEGPLDNPRADGSVELRDVELLMTDPQLAVVDGRGRILLLDDRLDVTGLEAELNGGRITVIGGLQRSGFTIAGGTFSVEGQGIALNLPEGMRTEVATTLALTFAERVRVSGRVDILRGAYREPLSLAAEIAAAARQRSSAAAAPATDAPSILAGTDLDIVVASAEDLVLDNNYGRMDLGLDLRLTGTAAQPAVIGRAVIREGGVLYLAGRTYQVEQGVIDFTNPRAIVPDLDLSARTRISGVDEAGVQTDYDVTLSITGTPDDLTTTLSSNPPGPSQADLVSLLATGRLADQAGGAGAAIAREQLLGYLSGEALGFVAQAVGLDTLRLERGAGVQDLESDPSIAWEVDPAQRLTISRRFSQYVNVVLSQNLSENGRLTWIATYTPRRAVEVRAISRDDRSRAYSLRHDVAFGVPPTDPGRSRGGARAPAERVRDLRFEGDPEFPIEELRSQLDLTSGRRFDFSAWQRDRERLRRFYLDRGYLEARVGARRVDATTGADGGSVGLVYDIDRGPITTLEIEGYRLPGSVTAELERIWSNAVIDVVLEADLAAAVRRHLAEEGYLEAAVTITRQPGRSPAGNDKVLRIAVEPGLRTPRRTVRFVGNQSVEEALLEPAVVSLGIDAWLNPWDLADGVARVYRQEGFLAATVRTGPIERSDSRAVLPVRIEEGPRFSISRVTVSGVEARSEAEVLQAFGLEPGALYRPAEAELARQSLEADYARQGFNSVVSRLDATPDLAGGAVALMVTVNEGPRQVLEDISIAGAQGVHPPVVANALGLATGDPADLGALYEGRRRLFDTGLFQRVNVEAVPMEGAVAPPGVEPVRARVTLTRWPAWRLRYGVEIRDEVAPVSDEGRVFGAGATADLQRRDVFGRPGSFGGALRLNNDQRIARAFLTFPTIFGRPIASSLFAARSRDFFEGQGFLSFITDRTTFTVEQRFRTGRRLQLAYGYQFERNHVFDPDPDPDDPFALDDRFRQSRLTSTLLLDTRDDPFDPRAGMFHSSNFEYAPEALGSDIRFVKYFAQQFAFVPIGRHITSASAVRLGLGRGFGEQRLIPSEQFFAGGANTVRGYAEDGLGGFDFFGDPIGGHGVLVINQEVRFPIYRWVHGVGFVDAGDVFRNAGDFSVKTLDAAVGAGLRFFTPFGLFRLDMGVPAPRDGRPVRWYFAFGQLF